MGIRGRNTRFWFSGFRPSPNFCHGAANFTIKGFGTVLPGSSVPEYLSSNSVRFEEQNLLCLRRHIHSCLNLDVELLGGPIWIVKPSRERQSLTSDIEERTMLRSGTNSWQSVSSMVFHFPSWVLFFLDRLLPPECALNRLSHCR
jgi:hypothetical protein